MLYFAIFLIFAYSPIGIYIAAVSSISPSRAIVSAIKAVAIGGVIFYVTYKGDKKVSLKEIKQKRAEILFKELKSGETMTKDDFDILDGMTPKDAMRALKLNEKNLKKLAKA